MNDEASWLNRINGTPWTRPTTGIQALPTLFLIVSCHIPHFRFSLTLRAAQVADGTPTEIGIMMCFPKKSY